MSASSGVAGPASPGGPGGVERIDDAFLDKARAHWTRDRVNKVTGGKRWPIRPDEAPGLLRVLGLLNRDGTMSADAVRKYAQLNHLLTLLLPSLEEQAARHPEVRVLDAACGTSFVALVVAWWLTEKAGRPCRVVGIDRNAKVIAASRARAEALGYGAVARFVARDLDGGAWPGALAELFSEALAGGDDPAPRPHLVVALHACDTATDEALALGVLEKADVVAVAPCCQAELARAWTHLPTAHALGPLFHTPNLRRDAAATATDALRLLLMRASGYEVTATEFVPSSHTPKNRLLLATRRGAFHRASLAEHAAMKAALGGAGITLEARLREAGRLVEDAAPGPTKEPG